MAPWTLRAPRELRKKVKDERDFTTRFARGTPVKSPIGVCLAEFNGAGRELRELIFFHRAGEVAQ